MTRGAFPARGKAETATPAKRTTEKNVLCSYDPTCAQIMTIKTWYYQNWDRYMCGFLITSTTSDCAIVEKYISKHVNLVISGAVKTLVECNWVMSVQRCQHWDREPQKWRPFCGPFCPVKFKTTATWAKIWLVWWQSLLISVGWSIINTSRTIFMLLVLWFGVFFIEKSSREPVEAISGLAVFNRFYQDSGRKSACVNDVQSPRAAELVNRSHRKKN